MIISRSLRNTGSECTADKPDAQNCKLVSHHLFLKYNYHYLLIIIFSSESLLPVIFLIWLPWTLGFCFLLCNMWNFSNVDGSTLPFTFSSASVLPTSVQSWPRGESFLHFYTVTGILCQSPMFWSHLHWVFLGCKVSTYLACRALSPEQSGSSHSYMELLDPLLSWRFCWEFHLHTELSLVHIFSSFDNLQTFISTCHAPMYAVD